MLRMTALFRPRVVAFDVIETLFALDPLASSLGAIGLPAESLSTFFLSMLRDAFALEVAGSYKPFREVARASLEVTVASYGLVPDKTKIARVLDRFRDLPAHADVRPAMKRLRSAGVRIITLTNGSAGNTEHLLSHAGVSDLVERTISIDEVGHWKPHREVYLHAARTAGVDPSALALVAAHAWDIHGAKRAGLLTGGVQRQDERFASTMSPPDVCGATLTEVIDRLIELPVESRQ